MNIYNAVGTYKDQHDPQELVVVREDFDELRKALAREGLGYCIDVLVMKVFSVLFRKT